jgi:hypothetical protein
MALIHQDDARDRPAAGVPSVAPPHLAIATKQRFVTLLYMMLIMLFSMMFNIQIVKRGA